MNEIFLSQWNAATSFVSTQIVEPVLTTIGGTLSTPALADSKFLDEITPTAARFGPLWQVARVSSAMSGALQLPLGEIRAVMPQGLLDSTPAIVAGALALFATGYALVDRTYAHFRGTSLTQSLLEGRRQQRFKEEIERATGQGEFELALRRAHISDLDAIPILLKIIGQTADLKQTSIKDKWHFLAASSTLKTIAASPDLHFNHPEILRNALQHLYELEEDQEAVEGTARLIASLGEPAYTFFEEMIRKEPPNLAGSQGSGRNPRFHVAARFYGQGVRGGRISSDRRNQVLDLIEFYILKIDTAEDIHSPFESLCSLAQEPQGIEYAVGKLSSILQQKNKDDSLLSLKKKTATASLNRIALDNRELILKPENDRLRKQVLRALVLAFASEKTDETAARITFSTISRLGDSQFIASLTTQAARSDFHTGIISSIKRQSAPG